MIKNTRGGVSQIITATILTPMIIFLFLNLTISQLHTYARNNLNQIAQESVNDIAKLGTVTKALNLEYKAEIDKYKPLLNSYEIIYTFSQFDANTEKFEIKCTMTDDINELLLNSLNHDIPTKVTVTINQTKTSKLQNIQNLVTHFSNDSSISVQKSIVLNK